MICKLCNQFFVEEDSFFGIFSFDDLCDECKNKFKADLLFESIPVKLGMVDYYYIYDNVNLSFKQGVYLSKYLDKIYKQILLKKMDYDIYIYLDDQLYYEESFLKVLLADYKKIFMFSLSRKDLVYKEIF